MDIYEFVLDLQLKITRIVLPVFYAHLKKIQFANIRQKMQQQICREEKKKSLNVMKKKILMQ